MIDIKLIEKKTESATETSYLDEYKKSLANRGEDFGILDQLIGLNRKRKELISQFEDAKSKLNKVSQEIAIMKRRGDNTDQLINDMQVLSKDIKEMEQRAAQADIDVNDLALTLPNKCHHSVPVGATADHNKIVRTFGEHPKFTFKPMEHTDIGERLNIIDFERAGKVTGARFAFIKGAAARMELALVQFMMNLHADRHGYLEMIPPFMANTKSFIGTGNLPKFKQDLFALAGSDYYLVPTAEVPVTNYYSDEILKEEDLPQKFVAYSPCFRSEAGSHGRDTKGLIRQHQFNKVELMVFAHPDRSYELHEQLTTHAEEVLKRLGLAYRVSMLCTGDISFGAAKCYDIEVWLPGQNAYREISSCSIFEDFQARRANIRFRPLSGGKPQFVHTINGSGLAVGRTLIAILENYQQEDGSVKIPEVLIPYMGGLKEIR